MLPNATKKWKLISIKQHIYLATSFPPFPRVLGIYFYKNSVSGENFYGFFNFRKPTVKLGPAWANTQTVSFERQGEQLGHQGAVGWRKKNVRNT